jgi:hypothetical protein
MDILYQNTINPLETSKSVLAPATLDKNFPQMGLNKYIQVPKGLDYLVRTVIKSGPLFEHAKALIVHTESMGRAGWYQQEIIIESINRTFGGILTTSTGIPLNVDLAEVDRTTQLLHPYILKNGEIYGAKTKDDVYQDAINSMEIDKQGIKSRLPLAGFYQESILVNGRWVDVNGLVNMGKISPDAKPYCGLFLMETPFRIADIVKIFNRKKTAISPNEVAKKIIGLFEKEYSYAKLQADFTNTFPLINLNNPGLIQSLLAYTSGQLGKLEKSMRDNHVFQPQGHSQQYSLHGEMCDNSTILFLNHNDNLEEELIRKWEHYMKPRLDHNCHPISDFFDTLPKINEAIKANGMSIDPEKIRYEFFKNAK